jgi:hypothetical protein
MTNLLEPPSFDPKVSPPHYFKLYETQNGSDCIWVFYREHEWKDGDYSPKEHMDFKKKVEVKTFLNQGMPLGFYRNGFDYALNVSGEVKWLKFAYEGLDGKEHGVFGRDPEPYEWSKKELWLE